MNAQNNEETSSKHSNLGFVEKKVSFTQRYIPELIDISDDNSCESSVTTEHSCNDNAGSSNPQQSNITQTCVDNMGQVHLQSATGGVQGVTRAGLETVTKAVPQTVSEACLLAFTGKVQPHAASENNANNSILTNALISNRAVEVDCAKGIMLQNNIEGSINNSMSLASQVSGISLAANMGYTKGLMLKSLTGASTTNPANFLRSNSTTGEMGYAQSVVMQNNSTDNINNSRFTSQVDGVRSSMSVDHPMSTILQTVQILPTDASDTSYENASYAAEAQNMPINKFQHPNERINPYSTYPAVTNEPVQNLQEFVQSYNPAELHMNHFRNTLPAPLRIQNFGAYNNNSENSYVGGPNQNVQRFLATPNQNQMFVPNQNLVPTASQNQIFVPTSNQNQMFMPISNQNLSLAPTASQNQIFVPSSNQNQRCVSSTPQNHRHVSAADRNQIFIPAPNQNQRFMVKSNQTRIFNNLQQSYMNNYKEVREENSTLMSPQMLPFPNRANCLNPAANQIQISRNMNYNFHRPEEIPTNQNSYSIPGHYSGNMLSNCLLNQHIDNSKNILRTAPQHFESQGKIPSKRSRRPPKSSVKSRTLPLNTEFASMANLPTTSYVPKNQGMNRKKAFHRTSGGLVSVQSASSANFNHGSISFPNTASTYDNSYNVSNLKNSSQNSQRNIHSPVNQMEMANVQGNQSNLPVGIVESNNKNPMCLKSSQNQIGTENCKNSKMFKFEERDASPDEVLNTNMNPCVVPNKEKNDIILSGPVVVSSSESYQKRVIFEEVRFDINNTKCKSNINRLSENVDKRKSSVIETFYSKEINLSPNCSVTESTSNDGNESHNEDAALKCSDNLPIGNQTVVVDTVNANDKASDLLIAENKMSASLAISASSESVSDSSVNQPRCDKVKNKNILSKTADVNSIPVEKAESAFRESRFIDFFEIVRRNTFAPQYHQELRTMWMKAQILNHHKITKLPVTAKDARILKLSNPPPETISETNFLQTRKQTCKVITVE